MKTVVFDSPFQDQTRSHIFGITFKSGVPQQVTDEQADVLLEKFDNEFLEGTAAEVGQLRNKTPNPQFGKQKICYFRLVEDTPNQASAPAASASTAAAAASSPAPEAKAAATSPPAAAAAPKV